MKWHVDIPCCILYLNIGYMQILSHFTSGTRAVIDFDIHEGPGMNTLWIPEGLLHIL